MDARLLGSLALVLLAACSHAVEAQSVSSQIWSLDATGAEGGFSMKVETVDERGTQRVRIAFDPAVDFLWRSGTVFMTRSGGAPLQDEHEEGLFADGQRIDVKRRELLVAGRSLGELPDAAEVEIRRDGVFVNGERRGPLR